MAHVRLAAKADRVIPKVALRYSRRRFGRVVEPVAAAAHHSGVLLAMGALETAAERGWRRLDPSLRWLAIQASAMAIGCSWCTDYGYYQGMQQGTDPHKVREVLHWRTTASMTSASVPSSSTPKRRRRRRPRSPTSSWSVCTGTSPSPRSWSWRPGWRWRTSGRVSTPASDFAPRVLRQLRRPDRRRLTPPRLSTSSTDADRHAAPAPRPSPERTEPTATVKGTRQHPGGVLRPAPRRWRTSHHDAGDGRCRSGRDEDPDGGGVRR